MYKKFLVVALVLALALTAGSALADEPSGTISIKLMSASAVMGASWGEGVLTFGAKTYAFKVNGLKVLSVGVTKASANGDVYKLTKLLIWLALIRRPLRPASPSSKKGKRV